MKAAVLHGREDLRIEDVPEPVCGPDELLLKVRAVGICGTDAHEYAAGPHMFPIHMAHQATGHLGPMVPGHEFAGTVVEAGSRVRGYRVGDLVASGAGYSCGSCDRCARGRTNLCRFYATVGLSRNGALAEFVTVPAAVCRQVEPYGLTPDAAALAQPMSIAVHAIRRGRLNADDRALVVGAGGIGAFLTFAASQITGTVVVSDIDHDRLAQAERLGATETILAGRDPIQESADFTVIYEVSGTAAGLRAAREVAGPGARIVLVGLQGSESSWDLRRLSLAENEVIGTNAHVCDEDLPAALNLLAARAESWTDVAPQAIPFDRIVADGLEPLHNGRTSCIKTLVDPWATEPRDTVMTNGAAR